MEVGKHYHANQKRITTLSDADWRVALFKCREHIDWRLRQRTLSGAHSQSNLGADPIEHYRGIAYEKILTGEWEWKEDYSLAEQMIRIIDSYISKEVEKFASAKAESFKILYKDFGDEFYAVTEPPTSSLEKNINDSRLQAIEKAAAGDDYLELLVEGIKEGKKRSDIALLLDLDPRQVDKLKEKLIRKVKIL